MAIYQVLYWQDIPAQIKVYEGARGRSYMLPDQFQEAIDELAMRLGLVGTDDYLEHWKWSEKIDEPGEHAEVRDRVIARLISEFDPKASQR